MPKAHDFISRTLMIDCSANQALREDVFLAVRLSGRGRIDAWLSPSNYRYGTPRFAKATLSGFISGDGRSSIAVPATAGRIIAVGAYTTRSSSSSTSPESLLGTLAPFSSMGPTLDKNKTGLKPDISAPGRTVVSARSIGMPLNQNATDAEHVSMQGTSMSAPHVTGLVALMLEANRTLSPERARTLLQESARKDGNTGAVPNDAWGFGKVDAHAALALTEMSDIEPDEKGFGCQSYYHNSNFVLFLLLVLYLIQLPKKSHL